MAHWIRLAMTTEDALAELELEVPWTRKLSCPKHSDSDPSLHIYDGDRGFYCFSCNTGGDGWSLLSHYLDVPVAELMRERGVKRGPRPRSRWEQLDTLERRANEARWSYHRRLREIWGADKRRFFEHVRTTEDRIAAVYGDSVNARYFPEDQSPSHMEQSVHDLELFLDSEAALALALAEMIRG